MQASPQQGQDAFSPLVAFAGSLAFEQQDFFSAFAVQQSPQPQAEQVQASPQQRHGAAFASPESARVISDN